MKAFNHSYRVIEMENSAEYGGNINLQKTLERGRQQDPNCYFKKKMGNTGKSMFYLNYVGYKGAAIKGRTGLHRLVWRCSQGVPLRNEWRILRLQQSRRQ